MQAWFDRETLRGELLLPSASVVTQQASQGRKQENNCTDGHFAFGGVQVDQTSATHDCELLRGYTELLLLPAQIKM